MVWIIFHFIINVIIKEKQYVYLNDKGNVFGGYSSIPWASKGKVRLANDCFLFTLTNIYNIEPTKFPFSGKYPIFLDSGYGPIFGFIKGGDLVFYNNFTNGSNAYSDFPREYQDILGKGNSIFTGDNKNDNIILKEMEVFKIF